MLIVDWGCRTGEVVNFVRLDIERERDVVAQKLEAGMRVEMLRVAFGAGE
jgi:hypothetical protein